MPVELEGLEKHTVRSPDLSNKIKLAIEAEDGERLTFLFNYMILKPEFKDNYLESLAQDGHNRVETIEKMNRLEIWGYTGEYGMENGERVLIGQGEKYLIYRSPESNRKNKPDEYWVQKLWDNSVNYSFWRRYIPDFFHIGFGVDHIDGFGGAESIELNWITRGDDASFWPVLTVTYANGVGKSMDVTLNIGGSFYYGPVDEIARDMLNTRLDQSGPLDGGITIYANGGGGFIGKGGATVSATPINNTIIVGSSISLGLSPAGGASGSAGTSNTVILYDFKSQKE